jgi:hypothetical protein
MLSESSKRMPGKKKVMWYGSLLKYSQHQDADAVELQGGQDSVLGARVLDRSALTLTHVAPCAFAIPRHLRHLPCQMKFRHSQKTFAFLLCLGRSMATRKVEETLSNLCTHNASSGKIMSLDCKVPCDQDAYFSQ